MVSPSTLKPSAPSANLLRFLRSQSEVSTHYYFSPNTTPITRPHSLPPACPWRLRSRPQSQRGYAHAAFPSWSYEEHDIHPNAQQQHPNQHQRRTATLEASLFPFLSARTRNLEDDPSSISTSPSTIPALVATPRTALKSLNRRGGYGNLQLFSGTAGRKGRGRGFIRRLFGLRVSERDDPNKLRPSDLPIGPVMEDGHEGNMFATGRSLAMKATNEPRLRCTELDENGNVTLVNGEFKKSELIAKYGLLPRDLRKIDSSVLPHILVRHSAILISLLHLRVLIKADRVLVFDAYGSTDSYTQSVFMYDLEGKLRQKEVTGRQSSPGALPYEFRALEAVLVSVTSGLEAEFEGVREPVVRVLRALEEDIDRDKLRHLLIYSKRLGTFEQKARLVRDAIEDLLEADDDLTSMYLTEKANGVHRQEVDHQEIEMLLESYHKVCDEIVQASGNLVTNIRNTEEIVKAILDANRNSLMLLDLKFSIGTLGLAAGTLCSALYGMNLKNFIEESDLGFATVSGACFVFTAFVCAYGLMKLRKVQRVRMWGEAGLHDRNIGTLGLRSGGSAALPNRANWRADTVDPLWTGLAGETRGERLKRLRQGGAASAALSATPPVAKNIQSAEKRSKQQRLRQQQQQQQEQQRQRQQQLADNAGVDTSGEESALGSAAISSGSR
ncbi:mitochondrial inner membrane magnesium transporter mrs2 [Blastomyces gilchristii SLH14081]|uniref:Mitochondrial inner membrane magnesium transporter MRS2 n=1 Tax=Blastomyces gilchristii (strain SLH14081) TaxID=559298 RepID=A0A179UYA7_BLAGS|nr:mitochondrial inner membrane magnesium transporter mrs2 [Blastomyces gilchristii SLH14081]OAT11392.1 mitochondrial inner membrane magnesium transporter mrs2 [Blastomyces gilchristii SLH14081]